MPRRTTESKPLPAYGALLRDVRHRSGLSLPHISRIMQEQYGRYLGPSYICGIESGVRYASTGLLADYAQAIGADPVLILSLAGRIHPALEERLANDADAQRAAMQSLGIPTPR